MARYRLRRFDPSAGEEPVLDETYPNRNAARKAAYDEAKDVVEGISRPRTNAHREDVQYILGQMSIVRVRASRRARAHVRKVH